MKASLINLRGWRPAGLMGTASKLVIALFLSAICLALLLVAAYLVCGILVWLGNMASWLLDIDRDARHHYSFTLNWRLWSRAEWRLLVWISIAAVLAKKLVAPIFRAAK